METTCLYHSFSIDYRIIANFYEVSFRFWMESHLEIKIFVHLSSLHTRRTLLRFLCHLSLSFLWTLLILLSYHLIYCNIIHFLKFHFIIIFYFLRNNRLFGFLGLNSFYWIVDCSYFQTSYSFLFLLWIFVTIRRQPSTFLFIQLDSNARLEVFF